MSYYFFVGDTMLPVPPPKMEIKIKGKNKTIDLINEGEVNIIKTPGLSEISFDARLPNSQYPFANYDSSLTDSLIDSIMGNIFGGNSFSFKGADYFLENIKTAKESQDPLRLVISRMTQDYDMLFDTNMLVTVESYDIKEDSNDGYDVTVPLKFKQYRPYGTKECEVTKDKDGVEHVTVKQTRLSPDTATARDYKIKNEQSIWEAVHGISGGNMDWRKVMKASGILNPCPKNISKVVLHLV